MKKAILMLLVSVMLIASLNISTLGAMPETVTPLWENTAFTTETMDFDGTAGGAAMRVTGKAGTTRVEGRGVVYKLVGTDWVYVTEASNATNGRSCLVEILFEGEIGYEYKAEYEFVVYKDGVGEVITSTLTAVCD